MKERKMWATHSKHEGNEKQEQHFGREIWKDEAMWQT